MSLPSDHLRPIWRQTPGNSGVFTIALDPREAEVVLGQGWATLDGIRYRADSEGWGDQCDAEGRSTIRCWPIGEPQTVEEDLLGRWSLPRVLRLLRAA